MRRLHRTSSEETVERLHAARSAGDPFAYLALALKASATYPRDGEVLIALVVALTQNQQLEEAADIAARVIDLSVDPAVLVQAALSLPTVGRSAQAAAALNQVFETGPHVSLIETEALFLRGWALGSLGRPRLAERYLRDALARDHERPAFIHGLAVFLVAQNRRGEAVELLDLARRIADDADRAETLEDLGAIGLR